MSQAEIREEIAHARKKIITLGRAIDELKARLEFLEKQMGKPAPATRKNRKSARLVEIDQFYTKRKINAL